MVNFQRPDLIHLIGATVKYLEIPNEYPKLNPKKRQQYFEVAFDPDSIVFSTLIPKNTGCTRTMLVSQDQNVPVIIISKQEGSFNWVNRDCVVVGLNEDAPYPDINSWLNHNRVLLIKLCKEEIDMEEFLHNMVRFIIS